MSEEFAELYEAELSRQVRSATLVLGSRQAAQDVVHDVFTEVYRRWDRLDDPAAYLQRSVVNRCRDVLRRRTVALRHRRSLRARDDDVPAIDAPLYDALGALPFNQRAAIVLRFYLDMTEAEIAAVLECSTGSVGPWIRRGLDRLAEQLHDEEVRP